VKLSPDTITGGDNAPDYSYEHTTIEGFSFTHMSGVGWYGDFGNLLTMATTGSLRFAADLKNLASVRKKDYFCAKRPLQAPESTY
jgi:putative alpha-1,2-mannosidase